MTEHDLEVKVVKLENSYINLMEISKDMKTEQSELYDISHQLRTQLAVLTQSIEQLNTREASRRSIGERVTMFVVGGFIAAAVSWIVRGGLGL
jgi:hypothetical protein